MENHISEEINSKVLRTPYKVDWYSGNNLNLYLIGGSSWFET
jgi:hypothetical protein